MTDRHKEQQPADTQQLINELHCERQAHALAKKVQTALFRIAEIASSASNMQDFYSELHAIVDGLMYAKNFIISLLDEHSELNFVYLKDANIPDADEWVKPNTKKDTSNTISAYVARTGTALLANQQQLQALEAQGLLKVTGSNEKSWLGVPLKNLDTVIGVIVVQSYEKNIIYTNADKELLEYISNLISIVLTRKNSEQAIIEAHKALERRVADRTSELEQANKILKKELSQREKANQFHQPLYEIANITNTTQSLEDLYSSLHLIISRFMYADNFIIALLTSDDGLHFVYLKDTVNEHPKNWVLSKEKSQKTISGYVIRTGKHLLLTAEKAWEMAKNGTFDIIGDMFTDWLGVPLKDNNKTLGIVVVQNYTDTLKYSDSEVEILNFASQQITIALTKKQAEENLKKAYDEMESRVIQRTSELQVSNQQLQKEIAETTRAEKLQAAMYEISELSNTTQDLDYFYSAIHKTIKNLMYAENLFIGLLNSKKEEMRFVYVKDQHQHEYPESLSMDYLRGKTTNKRSFTADVLDSKKGLLMQHADIEKSASGQGSIAYSWLGVPLLKDEEIIGIITVQSYTEQIDYNTADKSLLLYVSQHISSAIHRKKSADLLDRAHTELKQANDNLERRVEERTRELEILHKELLDVAHQSGMSEIATGILHDLGNILNSIETSSKRLIDVTNKSKISSLQKANEMVNENSNNLIDFLQNDKKGQQIFKFYNLATQQLASEIDEVQQQALVIRKCSNTIAAIVATQQKYAKGHLYNESIDPIALINDCLDILKDKLHAAGIAIHCDFKKTKLINGQKSLLLNVFLNLIKNAKESIEDSKNSKKNIIIAIDENEQQVRVTVTDSGTGISDSHKKKIFTHGFSTKTSGHGFGLHQSANYIRSIGGNIEATSEGKNKGAKFIVSLPVSDTQEHVNTETQQ